MSTDTSSDPLAPWIREVAKTHADSRHRSTSQCRGSVEFIDEAARLRGIATVQQGKAVSLERPIETRPAVLGDTEPAINLTVQVGSYGRSVHGGDVVSYNAHGTGNTHLDGLAHIGTDGEWHGSIPIERSETDEDTMVNWAQHGIATRAVLLNLAAARGVEWIAAGEPPTAEEFDRALEATGLTLEPGDALLIYQGRDRFEAAGNTYPSGALAFPRPGIGEEGAKWIASKDPGLMLWDFHDARANERGSLEVHSLIYAIGLCIIDNSDLGAAVNALKASGAHSGLLVAAPPAIYRSTGVLINPLLIF